MAKVEPIRIDVEIGARIIETQASRVELVEPWEAGKYDPPMQEWLKLPIGHGDQHSSCPACGSTHFGTANARGYFLVRVCHDEHHTGCKTRFRNVVTTHMITEILDALNGRPRRFLKEFL